MGNVVGSPWSGRIIAGNNLRYHVDGSTHELWKIPSTDCMDEVLCVAWKKSQPLFEGLGEAAFICMVKARNEPGAANFLEGPALVQISERSPNSLPSSFLL